MNDEPKRKPRKRGRPPTEPDWLKQIATLVAEGTPLRKAFWRLGMYGVTERQLKNVYRWVRFRQYYEEARLEYFRQWGQVPSRSRTSAAERFLQRFSGTGF